MADKRTPEQKVLDEAALEIGVHLECVVNLFSPSTSQAVKLTYNMGLNTIPVAADIDRVIVDAIEDANTRFAVQDYRLLKSQDLGLPELPFTEWPPHPDDNRPGDIVEDRPE